MIGFAIAAVAVYDVAFSENLNHRFLIYERIRMPIGKLLRIKLAANVVLSFVALAVPVLLCFIVAYKIIPHYGWIEFFPNTFGPIDEAARNQEQAGRHTMNQLLVYGEWVYGIACAGWVGLNAALYATFGFLLLLVIQRSFIALSIPFLLYMVGSFLLPDRRFAFFDSAFPFDAAQQPMWLILSLRTIIELGETIVLIRVRNDRAWLGLVVKKLCVPLMILLMLWGLAMGSTVASMPFQSGWSEFTTSKHWLNFFTHSFAVEGWTPLTAIVAQLVLLALFLLMLTVWLATTWIFTEKSWAVSFLAAGLMIGCLIVYHKQSHFPEWEWASIINWMLLLNARHTFGAFWPAFVGSPLLMLGCIGLIALRRNRIIFTGLFRIKRRLFR